MVESAAIEPTSAETTEAETTEAGATEAEATEVDAAADNDAGLSVDTPADSVAPAGAGESEPVAAESAASAAAGAAGADAAGADAAGIGDDADRDSADHSDDSDLDGEPEPEPEVAPAGPIELNVEEDEEIKKDWYILKVQSNRERSIAAALQRKVAIEGLEHLFGEILVPTEKVTEFKGGKKKIVERKLWPGYIAVEMHVNDDTWFAIRETGGIGDFTGSSGAPTPMAPHEVAKILHTEEEETDDSPKLDIKFAIGDKVKVNDGNFESFEGEVATIDEASGKISVMISIFGRSTPVELEYWQVEAL